MLIEELTEQQQMWELLAKLMDLDPDFKFTAKEIAQAMDYDKSYVSRLLYRLHINNALLMHSKAGSEAALYSLNKTFFTGGQAAEQATE